MWPFTYSENTSPPELPLDGWSYAYGNGCVVYDSTGMSHSVSECS